MANIEPLKKLLDEVPILEVYTQNLGFPYNSIISLKVLELRRYLESSLSKELNKKQPQQTNKTTNKHL